jgi:hypothetical protein
VRGIGDDALRCVADVDGEHREQIRGRVREMKFAVTLSLRAGVMDAKVRDAERSAVEQAAEEVAGSLF